MARNLEEIIQSEDPKIVSAAKRKAEKILQSIDDTPGTVATKKRRGIRNFWLIKCQRCKEENLSQRII